MKRNEVGYIQADWGITTFYSPVIIFKKLFVGRKTTNIILFWNFLTPSLADGFLLEFEWQQVFSILQDSS